MPSFPSQAHLAPRFSARSVEYSSAPTPVSTSPLLDDPTFSDVESDRHKETEPARASRIRRAWRKFKSFNWCTDLGFIAMALGVVVLMLALGVLTCFGLNVISTYVGGRILHYATPIRTIFYHTFVTAAYARIAFAGCAIVNVALLLLAPMIAVLVENRHGDDAATIAWWGTLALGMLLGSATAASLGIVVVPPERAPEGLSAIHALAAGSLGTVVVGIPVFVLSVLLVKRTLGDDPATRLQESLTELEGYLKGIRGYGSAGNSFNLSIPEIELFPHIRLPLSSPMPPPLLHLSGQYAEVFSVDGCEDPPPPYPGSVDFEETHEQMEPLQCPAWSPNALVSSPATLDEGPVSSGGSVLKVIGPAVILHILVYVSRSLATNAWGARAIEYAVGTGCVASTMMLVKTVRLASTLPKNARTEKKFLTALTVALSAGIPGIGYCICSLALGGSVVGQEFLTQAVSGAVPALFVMFAIQRMRLRIDLAPREI